MMIRPLTRLFFLCLLSLSLSAAQAKKSEYEAKALFLEALLRLTKFSDQTDTYKVLVLGKNPFRGHLKKLNKKIINGRRVKVYFRKSLSKSSRKYHLVYITKSQLSHQEDILAMTDPMTLTVADNKWFIKSGGLVNVVLQKQGVRWEINHDKLSSKHFKISSKLLRMSLNKK